jgi:hypothetical protein
MTERDAELLTKTLAKIEEIEAKGQGGWDQGEWVAWPAPDAERAVKGKKGRFRSVFDASSSEQVALLPVDCGTAKCFAGWAVALAGEGIRQRVYRWKNDQGEWVYGYGSAGVEVGGRWVPVSDRAEQLLGLDPYEAGALFSGSNSLDDLREYVGNLIDGKDIAGSPRGSRCGRRG